MLTITLSKIGKNIGNQKVEQNHPSHISYDRTGIFVITVVCYIKSYVSRNRPSG